jgi:hypothetical protein
MVLFCAEVPPMTEPTISSAGSRQLQSWPITDMACGDFDIERRDPVE